MEWTPGSLPETAEPNTLGLDGSRLANIKPYLPGYIDQGKLAGARVRLHTSLSRLLLLR